MVTYIIEKDKHTCKPRTLKPINGQKTLTGQFSFTPECWYNTAIYGTHLNKLTGFSTDLWNQDSLRLAWRPAPETNKFEIYAYVHLGGKWVRSAKFKDDLICVVGLGTEMFSISPMTAAPTTLLQRLTSCRVAEDNIATFVVGFSQVERHYPALIGSGWQQYFYFGGVPTAMRRMSMEMEYAYE